MATIDKTAALPPPHVWAIDRKRVRDGNGPVLVRAISWKRLANNEPWGIEGKTSTGRTCFYILSACHATPDAAAKAALQIAAIEIHAESRKFSRVIARLQAAREAAEALTKAAKETP
ncbi:MAG TPA: hypothetical protein VEC35_09250 [Noviherbaspirillum sp.]|nr:hypothetical protein [Noviherbaspirillum sp.]